MAEQERESFDCSSLGDHEYGISILKQKELENIHPGQGQNDIQFSIQLLKFYPEEKRTN